MLEEVGALAGFGYWLTGVTLPTNCASDKQVIGLSLYNPAATFNRNHRITGSRPRFCQDVAIPQFQSQGHSITRTAHSSRAVRCGILKGQGKGRVGQPWLCRI